MVQRFLKPNFWVSGLSVLQLIKFDQSDFFYFSSPSLYSMDDVGYVYIPSGCASKHSGE